jgi:galactokinase
MARITFGSTHGLADTEAFLRELDKQRSFLNSGAEIVVTRAPGRLDLMGGIADYSGSLVLELPIAAATHVALQRASIGSIEVLSRSVNSKTRRFSISTDELGELTDYAKARARFAVGTREHWAAYVVGALLVLMQEKLLTRIDGVRMAIGSRVPEGKGLSSSAALEVAVMRAIVHAFDLDVDGPQTAFLCQRVENLVAGAPCGVMDQMTAACGEEDRLLALLCQAGEVKGNISLPEELAVWGIDSGIRHAVSGADYGTVRTAAFMGYRMIADMAGLVCRRDTEAEGMVSIEDERWRGYLAKMTSAEFTSFAPRLPLTMQGEEFLSRYHGTTDAVTKVNRAVGYPVYEATRHPIEENARVNEFARLLADYHGESGAKRLGEMMYESHASYTSCGLGSPGTDEIVSLVRRAGSEKGLFGAKITGGGSGGTVAILGRHDAVGEVRRIANEYSSRTGLQGAIIEGSSPGALSVGHLRVMLD